MDDTNPRRMLGALARLAAPALLALAFAAGCNAPPDPAKAAIDASFDADLGRVGVDLVDRYEAAEFTSEVFASDWTAASGRWRAEGGKLVGNFFTDDLPTSGTQRVGAPMAILWLNKPLPREFTASWKAKGLKGANDLNAFFCSDGEKPSGYELVFGGRGNNRSWLGQWNVPDEMSSRVTLDKISPDALRMGKTYEFRVERTRRGIKIYRDGMKVMERREREPPTDEKFRHFGFSTWDNEAEFWDLKIEWTDSAPKAE